jgi:hypothetical protein
VLRFLIRVVLYLNREQYEQELQAEDEQYIQADGLAGQQVSPVFFINIQSHCNPMGLVLALIVI